MRTLCAYSPDQGDLQITQKRNNLDLALLASFCMDCDRLAFASLGEAPRSGPTQEGHPLAGRRV